MEGEQLLKKKGIKVTKGRLIIFNILSQSQQSENVEEIFSKCREEDVSIDLSTVYRTLELFQKKEIVEKFNLDSGRCSYLIKKNSHKHVVECKMCHKEIEIDCPMTQIEELVKQKTGFTYIEHHLKVEGICKECIKAEKDK